MVDDEQALRDEIDVLRKRLAQAEVRLAAGTDADLGKQRYSAFVALSTEGIWCFELSSPVPVSLPVDEQIRLFYERGFLIECNLAFARMYGLDTPEEILGASLGTMTPASEPANIEFLRAFIQSDYQLSDAESHEIDKDGHRKFILNNFTGVVENGSLVRAWGTQRDLTAHRILEDQLHQSQKMEAVGRLAAGFAHDFNNILAAIQGYAELLLRQGLPEAARRRLSEMHKAGERAAALVQQLLTVGRRQVLKLSDLDLREVVRETEDMLRRLAGEKIVLEIQLGPEACPLSADRGQIEQVIVNLVVNARDAMPEGGRLTIGVAAPGLEGRETSGGVDLGRYVVLTVTDTGVGMDEATQERIFEPFFTTKEHGRGTGLGLATVYGIVRQGEGQIAVFSAPGRGSTFRVSLPRRAREEPGEAS